MTTTRKPNKTSKTKTFIMMVLVRVQTENDVYTYVKSTHIEPSY